MRDDLERPCYVSHLVAEHRRVHLLLKQTRAAIVRSVQPDNRPSFENIRVVLQRLRDELAAHFREEEEGGCLDEAVSLLPRESAEVQRIEAEHPALLAEIDRLIGQCQTLPATPQTQHAVQQLFDELYQRLLAHEAAENRLVSQAFGAVANGDDNGTSTPLTFDV